VKLEAPEMRAMVLAELKEPLFELSVSEPQPAPGEIVVEVHACAVCRTDLHIIDGDLPTTKLPLILGHQIVGRVAGAGHGVKRFKVGDRVGVPWMGRTCGVCDSCTSGAENLCDRAEFTGYTRDGGFAEFTVADERFCLSIPEQYSDVEAAPLLCAGLIGYRSLLKTDNAKRIGIFGFGAAAHLIIQVAVYEGREVHVFTRSKAGQESARSLGAQWAGSSEEDFGTLLDAAIIFAPSGALDTTGLTEYSERRNRGLRRNPHERYSSISLQIALG
jgi:propanol-preferring alcohol dehydrogenase